MARRVTAAALLCGALVAACTTTSTPEPGSPEEVVFARTDCRTITGNAALEMEYERSKQICLGRAEAAAVAATTVIPVGYGIAGGIASGIQRGQAQMQVGTSTAISCMAEQGYVRRTRAEQAQACAAIADQSKRQAGK